MEQAAAPQVGPSIPNQTQDIPNEKGPCAPPHRGRDPVSRTADKKRKALDGGEDEKERKSKVYTLPLSACAPLLTCDFFILQRVNCGHT